MNELYIYIYITYNCVNLCVCIIYIAAQSLATWRAGHRCGRQYLLRFWRRRSTPRRRWRSCSVPRGLTRRSSSRLHQINTFADGTVLLLLPTLLPIHLGHAYPHLEIMSLGVSLVYFSFSLESSTAYP